MAIHTPNLQLVRYTGDTPRKLWEVKARTVPTLNKGDLVLLDAVTAVLMVKKYGFEMVDNSLLKLAEDEVENQEEPKLPEEPKQVNSAGESDETDDKSIKGDDGVSGDGGGEYKLPLASQVMELSNDEIKEACKYVGISTSRKKIENLKALLIPYLPTE